MKRERWIASMLVGGAGAVIAFVSCGSEVVSSDDGSHPVHPIPDAGGQPVDGGAEPGISHGGWTWSNTGPTTADLLGIWGSSASDVWFAGAAGMLLHWDGTSFTAPESGTGVVLQSIWGSSASDVWAVGGDDGASGDAVMLHYDGSSWSVVKTIPSAQLLAVKGSSNHDVWAVGAQGLALHFDGDAWSELPVDPKTELSDVWTDGAQVWAVGNDTAFENAGEIYQLKSGAWVSVTVPTLQTGFSGIWGTSESDLWVAGGDQVDSVQPGYDPSGYLAHWNGVSWDPPHVLPTYSTPLFSVFGGSSQQLNAIGSAGEVESFDGSSWTSRSLPGDYKAIWQSSPGDVWAAGLGGVLAHFDGQNWTQLTPAPPAYGEYTGAAIWSNGSTDAWAAGNGAISAELQHWDGNTWSPSSIGATDPAYTRITTLWGTGSSNMWAAGSGPEANSARIIHWDGTVWSDVFDQKGNYGFWSAWGASSNDVWFSGEDGLLVHWDGSQMKQVALPGPQTDQLTAVQGTSESDVWLAGSTNFNLDFRRWDGNQWSLVHTDSGFVTGMYVASTTDLWALGYEGTSLHFDGSSWSTVFPFSSSLGSVWGSSANDVWMVGWYGEVEHVVDGVATSVPVTSGRIVGVSGSGPEDVWMLTEKGAILHHP